MKINKQWKKVLIGIISLIILAFVVDRIAGVAIGAIYKNSKYGIFHRQEYCLHESKDDIIILGSSRAAHHYVPQVFSDSLQYTCYNCGSDGMCVYYHYAILSSFISRGDIPKFVIYDVMPTDVQVSYRATFNLEAAIDRLLPNYGEYPEIDSLILLNGWKEKFKLQSHLYKYNSKLVQLIKCNFIPWPEDKGYEALVGSYRGDGIKDAPYNNDPIEEKKIYYLRKLINVCKSNDIVLVFVLSPMYVEERTAGVDMVKAIASEEGIPCYDYQHHQSFISTDYYYDDMHLNNDGAHEFSKMIAHELKMINTN